MDYENIKEGVEHHCELWLAQCKAKWWKEQHDLILKKMVELESRDDICSLHRYGMDKEPERYPVIAFGEELGHVKAYTAYNINGFERIKKCLNPVCWIYADKALVALPYNPENGTLMACTPFMDDDCSDEDDY